MKKVIFGSALMISGIIGSVGWMIIDALTAISGWWNQNYFNVIFALSFFVVFVIGVIVAISGLKKDRP